MTFPNQLLNLFISLLPHYCQPVPSHCSFSSGLPISWLPSSGLHTTVKLISKYRFDQVLCCLEPFSVSPFLLEQHPNFLLWLKGSILSPLLIFLAKLSLCWSPEWTMLNFTCLLCVSISACSIFASPCYPSFLLVSLLLISCIHPFYQSTFYLPFRSHLRCLFPQGEAFVELKI